MKSYLQALFFQKVKMAYSASLQKKWDSKILMQDFIRKSSICKPYF